MKFYMTGQEKGDLLIQVTAWAGLMVYKKSLKHFVTSYQRPSPKKFV
jgi:hypothetical protein